MWDQVSNRIRTVYAVLAAAGRSYGVDRVSRMSAAVAYRTMFALTPLLLIALFTLGLVLGNSQDAQDRVTQVIEELTGPTVSDALEEIVASAVDSSGTAGLVGLALLLWTGSSLFLELQNDLNDIFGVPYEQTAGMFETAKKRLIGFVWSLSFGLVVGAVWLLNSTWRFLEGLLPESMAGLHDVVGYLTPLVSLILLPFLFGLVFQTLTRAKVAWRAVWWGSFFTSVMFIATSYGVSVYFRLSQESVTGLAAALFVILLVAYVLSAVFLIGAEVIKVHDRYLRTGVIAIHEPEAAPVAFVSQPPPVMPFSTLIGFAVGLLVGRRRRQ